MSDCARTRAWLPRSRKRPSAGVVHHERPRIASGSRVTLGAGMGGPTRTDQPGCLIVFAVVAAELLFVGWFLGQFLLAPNRCGGPGCETMRTALNLSVFSAVVGIGCLVLLASNNIFNIRIPLILLLV